jgi:hypothetical protein
MVYNFMCGATVFYAVFDDHVARFSPAVNAQVTAIVADLGGKVKVPEARQTATEHDKPKSL